MEPLIEGKDYYMENGFMVLTENYLRKKGSCCHQGCRHCPYPLKEESVEKDEESANPESRTQPL